ncbi:cadherin-87A [Folsomia candida]|uniref:cadherin-87A n=1 Tax=Folsomia candida TaxID=158441 RepID=UPI000B90346F|nr:cadherin-87A [Folsomia candida]XP_035703146.1 cadherin-87A [Folsomia candida]XP_035703147.1 cadherin-87A [Folsomia candida]
MGLQKSEKKSLLPKMQPKMSIGYLHILISTIIILITVRKCEANLPPYFTEDMNNHVIPENTPLGTIVYTLKGVDPEGSPVKFGLMGTDRLKVDEKTGVVTVVKVIDRETTDRLKLVVTIEDVVKEGVENNNVVRIPSSVTISDSNDNAPTFLNQSIYENVEVMEDTRVGSKILGVDVVDPDLTGMALSLTCTASPQSPEACTIFPVVVQETTAGLLKGEVRLGQALDFNKRSLYQFKLTASDGEHKSSVEILLRIRDVQNTPPIFTGAMAGRVMEDADVGTLVMLIQARDGDLGKPRDVRLSLLTNPGEVFQLDPKSGRLTTTRPLDRETLGSLLTLEVKAMELPHPGELTLSTQADIDILTTTKNVTVLIDDVNDSEPKFNKKEYFTEIGENTGVGTPLPDLGMVISDADTGTFSDFTLRIEGPLADLFDIQPKFASGSVQPVIRVKKAFDHENPNERKFILLVVAQNTDEPELFSTATVTIVTLDENDNRPKFDRDVYQISIPESTKPGTKIGEITAEDPDSNEFGNEGLIYQIIGTGSKRFTVNNRTGEIYVAPCSPKEDSLPCLDYETQKTYDLLYMASDTFKRDGFIKSVVPLQIILTDSNDSPVTFPEPKYGRTLPENSAQFEPPFYIVASDLDALSVITYQILAPKNSSIHTYFRMDENSGELAIRRGLLPPANYSFKVEASDGLHSAVVPVLVQVTDINNHAPSFSQTTLDGRVLTIPENTTVGSLIVAVKALDPDLRENGVVRYSIDKGAYGYFEIDPVKGDITLVKELDDDAVSNFDLLVTAYDQGSPSMRTSISVQISVGDVYHKLPKMTPGVQRIQVSESAEIGEEVTVIGTNAKDLNLGDRLQFDFVDPIEARNSDNQAITGAGLEMVREWFRIDNDGKVRVANALQRDLVTAMNLTVMITSEWAKPGSKNLGSLMITVFEVNDKPPTVEDMEIEILEELPPGQAILTLEAEDPEGGQISHYFIEKGSEYFSVDNKTGEVKVAGRLDYEHQPSYNVTVVVVDSGVPQLSSTATIMVSLVNDNDNDPKFDKTEYEASLEEHPTPGKVVAQVTATDLDVDSTINYEIVPSEYSPAFEINRLGEVSISSEGRALIDRETMEHHSHISLSIKASDGERVAYTTLRIRVLDINDNRPTFPQKSYHITVHAPLRAKQDILRVAASHGADLPETDRMHYSILEEGNENGIFEIDAETGVLRAAQAYEKAGEMSLSIQVDDVGGDKELMGDHTDKTTVLVQILPGNFKKPEFLFPNKINSTLVADESNVEEIEKFANSAFTKVLGQILAFDPDEGDAGKMQFFFKEGDNLVTETERFRIETETGKVHQIRPLDREEMNKYDLVVVAKDSGIPVSTQAQHVLTIKISDIDDHKPYFRRREYDFTIKENSPESTFIGQVSAEDEDEGKNAQIFYFLVTTAATKHLKEDIRVDIKTGMIHSNAVLDRERIDSYQLYVRAVSSPIFNKSMELMDYQEFLDDFSLAAINITVLDENDNSPRFVEKQYYAAINSEAEPGREIMTLKSIDIDSPLTSPVSYSLLGANLILDDFRSGGSVIPSPFRVDAISGRLTLSQSAMRQYSGGNNRFQVKIGVRESVAPYHSDTTQVQVWVVESAQETILTVESPPKSLIKEGLIDVLTNITGNYVLITKISPHVGEDLVVNKEWSDVFVTAIDKTTFQPVPVSQFLQALDLGHDHLRTADMPIVLHSAVPAVSSVDGDGNEYYFNGGDAFDAAFAGLIALIALLCMGLAAIIACCCCINRMYEKDTDSEKQTIYGPMSKYPLHVSHPSIPGTPNMTMTGRHHNASNVGGGDMIEDMATDNPLWIDHKVKTYEEQELTMQVASELDHSNGSVDIGVDDDDEEVNYIEEEDEDGEEGDNNVVTSIHHHNHHLNKRQRNQSPQFSHAYATLHPQPRGMGQADNYDNINILGEDTIAVHL